jgi:quercetin dioxygenase-like cupin family protein
MSDIKLPYAAILSVLVIDHKSQPVVSWRPGNKTLRHCSKALGSDHLTCGEQWFEAGTGAPLHHHPEGIEEIIVVLEGSARFVVDGQEVTVHAGQSIILPALSHHGFVALTPLHIGGGGLSSAVQTTIFDEEPELIFDIGDTKGSKIDEHRRLRVT